MRPTRRKTPSAAVPAASAPSDHSPADAAGFNPSPTALIETQLTDGSEPVLGLYLHTAYYAFMSTYESRVGRGEITPSVIGVLALLALRPGMSQAELARLMGLERATVGVLVARAMDARFVRRTASNKDARRYSLHLTTSGEQMLAKLRQRIPEHEKHAAGRLSPGERLQLRALLDKLVYG
jgi:DNA-binding MarR family transcriptional regulator